MPDYFVSRYPNFNMRASFFHKPYYIHNMDESICFNNLSERVCNATRNLLERGLILEIKENGKDHNEYMVTWMAGDQVSLKGFLSFSEEDEIKQNVVLKFTLRGLDLADKYDNWWSLTGLWFAEYKDHWFWLIVSFLGGIIGALIVNWLSK